MSEYFELMGQGGPLIIPIFLASVIALAVFIERIIALRSDRVFPSNLAVTVLELVTQNNYDAALGLAQQHKNPLGALIQVCLQSRKKGRSAAKERMEEVGSVEVARLSRYVGTLSSIATVTPLLGLLGTVTGMIKVFKSVAAVSDPQIAELAGGIWEALLTTVAGLAVAIPAFLAYRYLEGRIDKTAETLQEYGLQLLEQVFPTAAETPTKGAAEGDK